MTIAIDWSFADEAKATFALAILTKALHIVSPFSFLNHGVAMRTLFRSSLSHKIAHFCIHPLTSKFVAGHLFSMLLVSLRTEYPTTFWALELFGFLIYHHSVFAVRVGSHLHFLKIV
jgi:hypothetical protein